MPHFTRFQTHRRLRDTEKIHQDLSSQTSSFKVLPRINTAESSIRQVLESQLKQSGNQIYSNGEIWVQHRNWNRSLENSNPQSGEHAPTKPVKLKTLKSSGTSSTLLALNNEVTEDQ